MSTESGFFDSVPHPCDRRDRLKISQKKLDRNDPPAVFNHLVKTTGWFKRMVFGEKEIRMTTMTITEKRTETASHILEVAKDVFAEQGFAGARVDEIARRAGVNKATLYYQIGDKKALYAEVRKIEAGVLELTAKKDYLNALSKIVVLKPSVDAFFDKVMVMAEDESLRSNRLALLAYTAKLFSNILDFSQLQNG